MTTKWRCALHLCAAAILASYAGVCPVSAAELPQEAIYAVTLNGDPVSDGTMLLKLPHDRFFVNANDLQRWHVTITSGPAFVYHGEAYYSWEQLGALKVTVDQRTQQLDVILPLWRLQANDVRVKRPPELQPTRGQGAFLNYTFYGQASSTGSKLLSGLFASGITRADGVLLLNVLATSGPALRKVVRLDTTWQHDNPAKRVTVLAGDGISAAGDLGGAIRFGGFQIASNFATDPNFVTFPVPELAGQAAVPSTLSLYVNDVQTLSAPVPPGPFTISQIPVVTGAGQLQLSVRDVLGRVVTITQPYYAAPQLLKRGLTAYSYEAGFERHAYGLDANDYGRLIASATDRFGLSDSVTGEAHAEFSPQRGLFSVSGDYSLGTSGVVGLGVALSGSHAGSGNAGEFHYAYVSRRMSAGLRFEGNSESYTTLATLPSLQIVRQAQVQLGIAPAQHAYLNGTFTQQQTVQGEVTKIAALSASFSLQHGVLNGTVLRTVSPGSRLELQLVYSQPLDAARLLTLASDVRAGGVTNSTEISQNLPAAGVGLAARISTSVGDTPGGALRLTQQDDSGTRTLDLMHAADVENSSATVSGALSLFHDRLFASRSINDAYGLAQVPGYPGVRIFVNGLEQGKTDARGDVVLSDLVSYRPNNVTLENADLPLTANVPREDARITPYAHSAVLVPFAAVPAGGFLLSVESADGQMLPAGTLLELDSKHWPVADHGAVFIFGLASGRQVLAVYRRTGVCHLAIVVPKDVATIPDLGRVVCR